MAAHAHMKGEHAGRCALCLLLGSLEHVVTEAGTEGIAKC